MHILQADSKVDLWNVQLTNVLNFHCLKSLLEPVKLWRHSVMFYPLSLNITQTT